MDAKGIVEKYTDYLFNFEENKPSEYAEEGYIGFNYTTDGYDELISLDSLRLWHSEDDDREWDEELEEYKPMDELVIRKLKTHVEAVNKFVGFLEKDLKEFGG